MSVAQGMSREDREVATFASIIGFALFHTTIRFFLSLKGITADTVSIDYLMGQGYSLLEATQQNAAYDTVMGIFTYRMSIFGGYLVGLWTAMIHNRFHETQLRVAQLLQRQAFRSDHDGCDDSVLRPAYVLCMAGI